MSIVRYHPNRTAPSCGSRKRPTWNRADWKTSSSTSFYQWIVAPSPTESPSLPLPRAARCPGQRDIFAGAHGTTDHNGRDGGVVIGAAPTPPEKEHAMG